MRNLCGSIQGRKVSLSFHHGREATVGRADPAAVPVADEVPPDQGLQMLNGHGLRFDAVIEQLSFHPGPYALTAGVVVTAAAVAVHALADAMLFHRGPIGPAGVLGASVRVDDGASFAVPC